VCRPLWTAPMASGTAFTPVVDGGSGTAYVTNGATLFAFDAEESRTVQGRRRHAPHCGRRRGQCRTSIALAVPSWPTVFSTTGRALLTPTLTSPPGTHPAIPRHDGIAREGERAAHLESACARSGCGERSGLFRRWRPVQSRERCLRLASSLTTPPVWRRPMITIPIVGVRGVTELTTFFPWQRRRRPPL
jgi:hypothetical protein